LGFPFVHLSVSLLANLENHWYTQFLLPVTCERLGPSRARLWFHWASSAGCLSRPGASLF